MIPTPVLPTVSVPGSLPLALLLPVAGHALASPPATLASPPATLAPAPPAALPAADFALALAAANPGAAPLLALPAPAGQQAAIPAGPAAVPAKAEKQAVIAQPAGLVIQLTLPLAEDAAPDAAPDRAAPEAQGATPPEPVPPWASLLVPELLRLPPPPPAQPPVAGPARPAAMPAIGVPALPVSPAPPAQPEPAAVGQALAAAAPAQLPPMPVEPVPGPPRPAASPAPPAAPPISATPAPAAPPLLWPAAPPRQPASMASTAAPAPRPATAWQRSLPAADPAAPLPAMLMVSPSTEIVPTDAARVPAPGLPVAPAMPDMAIATAAAPAPAARPRLPRDAGDGAAVAGPANVSPLPQILPPMAAFLPPERAEAPPAGPLARPFAADPATSLAIASDRLGMVQVEVAGDTAGLAVSLASPAPAAPIIDAAAPRLVQDLAQAGIILSALSINGQRSDLGGGQRQPRRGPQAEAVAALGRSPSARLNRPAAPSTDRFA
jgi:hypothetical protein